FPQHFAVGKSFRIGHEPRAHGPDRLVLASPFLDGELAMPLNKGPFFSEAGRNKMLARVKIMSDLNENTRSANHRPYNHRAEHPTLRSIKLGRTQSTTCFAASAMCSAFPPKSCTPMGRSHSSKSRYSRVRSFRRKTPSDETNSVTRTSAPRSLQSCRKILSDTPAIGAR